MGENGGGCGAWWQPAPRKPTQHDFDTWSAHARDSRNVGKQDNGGRERLRERETFLKQLPSRCRGWLVEGGGLVR